MANRASHFVGFPIFIYDIDDNLITRTVVTGYGKEEMYIEVAEGLEDVRLGTRLQLLIIHSTGASELNGTLKSVRQGIYEISIYGEHQREVRESSRRTINASAIISDMVADFETEAPSEPLAVTIVNMSTSGILIDSRRKRLQMGMLLQIEFKVSKKTCVIYGEVVREQAYDDGTFKYGCKLYFFDSKQ